jgi:hypothetical protein
MIAIITSAKSPYIEEDEDPELIMNERGYRAIECGMPFMLWESKKITPPEMKEQTLTLFQKIK